MTNTDLSGLYDFLHVVCPDCSACARFEYAWQVHIKTRKDQEKFKALKAFEVQTYPDGCGHTRHCALVYGKLNMVEQHLPEGYALSDFVPVHRYYLGGGDLRWRGQITCSACGLQCRDILTWPADAYFKIDYKGETLWAYNRRWAGMLRNFIEDGESHASIFRKIPAHFRNAKARDEVIKRLDKILTA